MKNMSICVQAALFITLLLTLSNLSAIADQPRADKTITESTTQTLTTLETSTTTETSTSSYETTATTLESGTTASTLTEETTLRSTSTTTETATIWPSHGPDKSIDETVLINQLDPDITNNVAACCPTTFAMILKWMGKKYNMPLPSFTDSGLVNFLEGYFKTDAGGTNNWQVVNVMLGLKSFMNDIEPNSPYMFAISYQPWSLQDYKGALDGGSAVAIRIKWINPDGSEGGGHCIWGIGAGGQAPRWSDGSEMDSPVGWIKGTYAPIILADPWGGRIVSGWVNVDGELEYFNPTLNPGHWSRGKVASFWKLTPKALLPVDPVEGYTVVAGDGNYYVINATRFKDVSVSKGKVSGITDGKLLRASGPVYGLVNGTVLIPSGVTLTEINPKNFPSLSISIINGTEPIVDSPGMKYFPSMTSTLLSPEPDASLTTGAVILTAKVTVNGTGEASSPVADAEVHFFLNDREIGVANTDSTGVATLEYPPESTGTYSWYVRVSSPTYPEDISWPPRQFSVMLGGGEPVQPQNRSGSGGSASLMGLIAMIIVVIVVAAVWKRRKTGQPRVQSLTMPQPPSSSGFCIECGAQIKLGKHFCQKCGTPVAPTSQTNDQQTGPTCSNCGSHVPAGKKFCTSCGKRLVAN